MKSNQFVELSAQEVKEVNGGWIIQALLFQVVMEIIDGDFFSDIKKGFNEIK